MITRRTLAKGIAWSVPAVVAVTPAPAFAASPQEPCATVTCKNPGEGQNNKDYEVDFSKCKFPGAILGVLYLPNGNKETNDPKGPKEFTGSGNHWTLSGADNSSTNLNIAVTIAGVNDLIYLSLKVPPC